MTRDDLIAAGWHPWHEDGCPDTVWEHPNFPKKQFSFYAACIVQRIGCDAESPSD
jgi:hypothetical protein